MAAPTVLAVLPRRSWARFGLPFLGVAALFVGLVAYQLYASFQAATEGARTHAQNLAHVLESKLHNEFDGAQRVGAAIAEQIAPQAMHAASVARYQSQISHWLQSRLPDVQAAEALRIFDANGDLLYSSTEGERRFNIADRPHFFKLKADAAIQGMYSEVLLGRATGSVLLPRSQVIRDAKGAFLGTVTIAIDLKALHQHFSKIDIGPSGVIVLRRMDNGALVVRFPGRIEVDNKPVPDSPLLQAARQGSPSGVLEAASPVDGISRLLGYRTIEDAPFLILVGIAQSDYLAKWRRDALIWSCGSLFFLLVLAAVWFRLLSSETRQRQSDQYAQDIGERLRGLYELSPLGIGLNDMQGRFVEFNHALQNMLGYTAQELKTLDYGKLTPPQYAAEDAQQMEMLTRTRRYGPYEKEFTRKGGGRVPVRLNGIGIRASDGQAYIWSIVEDITERKRKDQDLHTQQIELEMQNTELFRAQEELNVAQGRYFDLYDRAPVGYCTLSEAGLIQQANLAVTTMLGTARGTLVGQPISRLIHMKDQDVFYRKRKLLFESGEPQSFDLRMVKHDGTFFWAHLEVSEAKRADGARELRVALSDITERRQAEAEVRKLSHAVEQSPASVMITDPAGNIEYVNPRFEEMTGYAKAEVLGANPRLLQSGTTSVETYSELWRTIRAGGEWRGELCNRRKDGSLFWEHAAISGLTDEQGQIIHYVGVKEDITDLKATEARLLIANEELAFENQEKGKRAVELTAAREAADAANIAKSQFLATMSHEIRTPMNGILGMAQVLLMPGVSEAERVDYARTILGSGQTLLALLNDILDLSKIEAGKVVLESVALDPGTLIGEVQGLFAEIARAKGLRIETDWSRAPRRYTGDSHRLRQMLSNLVGNAIKFTAKGQIRIEAREIEGHGPTVMLEYSVADSGIGIAKDKQSLLFQPFSQADSSITRSYGGSGLGLSIVTHLARLMGGEVGLESEAGRGSRFWFRIRAGLDAADAAGDLPEFFPVAGAAPGAPATQFSGRVLVVEDNPFNQKVIKILLDKLGLSSALAEDGQQAVDAIAQGEAADLVLMDVQMPGMDGYAATRHIRKWEEETGGRRCPIVALTAEAFGEDLKRCLEAGMDEVLTKPVDFGALRAVLGKWLPAAPGAEAPPAAHDQPVDIPRVVALVDEIMPLLAQNRFDAITRFRELQQAVAGTGIAAEMGEIGRLLEQVRFDLALDRLRGMAATHGWGVASHDQS